MARTALTPADVVPAGTAVTLADANVDGHTIPGTGDVFVLVRNAGDASIDVTVPTPYTQDGLALADRVVAVGAGVTKLIGPFPPRSYTDEVDGLVDIDFSDVTNTVDMEEVVVVTVKAFQL